MKIKKVALPLKCWRIALQNFSTILVVTKYVFVEVIDRKENTTMLVCGTNDQNETTIYKVGVWLMGSYFWVKSPMR